jgi:transposase
MRTEGSPEFLEAVRRLAVARVRDGYDPAEVAEFLGVHASSVYRWAGAFERGGEAGLAAAAASGRPPKLTARQAGRVLSWVRDRRPQDFGFETGHWTAPRLAAVVERRLGVRFNPRYLNDWLARRGISPQLPQPVPRERDEAAVRRWVSHDWPAIKRGRKPRARRSCSPTRAGC